MRRFASLFFMIHVAAAGVVGEDDEALRR